MELPNIKSFSCDVPSPYIVLSSTIKLSIVLRQHYSGNLLWSIRESS
nr:MAG TPA: hypothetical protein [Caudoviricetes sp.]